MKRLFAILLSVLMLSGCKQVTPNRDTDTKNEANTSVESDSKNEIGTYRQIGMDEAVKLMAEETDYIILDVRTKEEYEEKHIKGAILVFNEEIGTEPPEQLPDKDQLILVYCRSGNRSKMASEKLANMGYTNIVEFGGIRDWNGEVVTGANP